MAVNMSSSPPSVAVLQQQSTPTMVNADILGQTNANYMLENDDIDKNEDKMMTDNNLDGTENILEIDVPEDEIGDKQIDDAD